MQTERSKLTFDDLRIRTKDKQLVRLAPNAVQERFLDEICPNWRSGDYKIEGLRMQLLKARQFGFSTIIAALFFLDTYNTPNTYTVVIADDLDNSEALFQMVSRFHKNLPPEKRLPTKYASKRELYWPETDSIYQILTAGKREAGRSRTINNLHMSERPFWTSSDILTGLLQTVPEKGNIFDESTANGEGNDYHSDYQLAKKGESTFRARFYAWFEHAEYTRELPEDWRRINKHSDPKLIERFGDEEELAGIYDLSDEQLAWRRQKIMEPGMGNKFVQEYPANDKEAFRVSGSKFFHEFDEDTHVITPYDIPHYWTPVAGLDWGYGAPFCFLLAFKDDMGNIVIVGEEYEARLTNPVQAERCVSMLQKWGLDHTKVNIYCDPSMWNVKTSAAGVGHADIEDFQKVGLRCIKSHKNEQGGWSNLRKYLSDSSVVLCEDNNYYEIRALQIFRGHAPNLVRTFPQQKYDKLDPEKIDTDLEDHAVDCLRYLTNSYERNAIDPADARKPKEKDWNPETRDNHGKKKVV